MKILLVLTGGTIGSIKYEGVINVTNDHEKINLIHKYYKITNDLDTIFDIIQPYNVLSENLDVTYWNLLYKAIVDAHYWNYDGIIITHGSDTLVYTATFIELMFFGCDSIFILTASNVIQCDNRSNAISNFISCVQAIKSKIPNGIYVFYGDTKKTYIYSPRTMLPADSYNDKFSSCDGNTYGYVVDGQWKINTYNNKKSEKYFKNLDINLTNNVLMFWCYPGNIFSYIKLGGNLQAFLLVNCNKEYLTDFLNSNLYKQLKNDKIEIYVLFKNKYVINEQNADINIVTKNTYVRIYVKLVIAYGQNQYPPKQVISTFDNETVINFV